MFSGKSLSALPMYTVPFTTVGEEVTISSFVSPLQIALQTKDPHGPAGHGRAGVGATARLLQRP